MLLRLYPIRHALVARHSQTAAAALSSSPATCRFFSTTTVHAKKERDGEELPHFRKRDSNQVAKYPPLGEMVMSHPVYSAEELNAIAVTHSPPRGFVEHYAYYSVQMLRFSFDVLSGYKFGRLTENKWLTRIIFLETVAGVPGMVAAMVRHLHSLRRMRRDAGWIHTLLEEAENERMHLMTALQLKKPSRLFRLGVLATQGAFTNLFFVAYLCSPRYCHRFVGYLEEEAVRTYTRLLDDIDAGRLARWANDAAPEVACRYWRLPRGATLRDMVLAIRADEAHHRLVNHTLAEMQPGMYNPFRKAEEEKAAAPPKL